ncbi:MAG: hypothetical protein P4M11_03060 [Candidatus Pacebacteria bacterium]|nr:hypothetical protein [Candidatus Paceibacterota bacterium]
MGEYLNGNYEVAEKCYRRCFIMFDGDPQLYFNFGLLKLQYTLPFISYPR